MPKKPVIVQFGAGNIGRSLVGQLFATAGYEVVFVDALQEIVEALNRERGYLVRVKDRECQDLRVEGVRAVSALDGEAVAREVAGARVIATAVGPAALPAVCRALAAGLARRREPVSIILCENLRNAASKARTECLRHLPDGFDIDRVAGFVGTSIGKMVPLMPDEVRRRDPLEVWAEAYNRIIADADAFIGPEIELPGLVKHTHFAAHVDRKLFIHNLGHAVCAYHGFLAGCTTIWQSMAMPEIAAATRGAMWESGRSLIARYPHVFDEASQRDEIEDLLARFHNRALGDTVYRVGRDLPRKLSREDRFVAALRCNLEHGVEPVETLQGFRAALEFRATDEAGRLFPADQAFHERLEREGLGSVLCKVCGMDPVEDRRIIERLLSVCG